MCILGAVFDNSYDKAPTAAFQIGVRAVVPGWDAAGQTDAAPPPGSATGPQVTGPLGAAPTVTVLATGTGPAVKNGQLLAQFVAVTWAGQPGRVDLAGHCHRGQ